MKRVRRLLAQPEGPRAGLTPVFSAVILTVTLVGAMAAWQTTPQTKPAASAPPQAAPSAPAVAVPVARARPLPPVEIAQVQPPRAVRTQAGRAESAVGSTIERPYRKWLNEDVAYIITDAGARRIQGPPDRRGARTVHRAVLAAARPDAGHAWRTNSKRSTTGGSLTPTSTSPPRIPGWKTDRGRIYITYGPPDEIDSHPSGGKYEQACRRGRRHHVHLPVRTMALPVISRTSATTSSSSLSIPR